VLRTQAGYACTEHVPTTKATHVVLTVAADFLLNLIAYNLIRIPKLVAA
jgi:hypothetical protein